MRRQRLREKEKEETIWRRKISFCGGEENRRRKRRKIFGEGKYLFAEEKKGKEDILSEKIFFVEEKKNGGGKGGKCNREENIVTGERTGGREWKARKRSWRTLK